MAEYIERGAVRKLTLAAALAYGREPNQYVSFLDELENIPAADVAEVRHGRWIDGVCSECGFDAMYYKGVPAQVYTDYRPNCGARMDKEDEHETD
jgi:hypothetical protein